jgi:hypothetical protein
MFLMRVALVSTVVLVFAGCEKKQASGTGNEPQSAQAPQTSQRPGPNPSVLLAQAPRPRPAPDLSTTSEAEAKAQVAAFVDWASASTFEQTEDLHRAIASAAKNEYVLRALCDEADRSEAVDHSRTIITLSIIGEVRHPVSQGCLVKFLHRPFPEKGTVIDGEIVEQTSLGSLQGKAVDGLAYQHTAEGDKEVLWAVSKHPSRIVRAEAIDAYLWNHNDSAEARAMLSRYVHPDEQVFMDRVRRGQNESAEEFNRKLAVFTKKHPELRPPAPERSQQGTQQKAEDNAGPSLRNPPAY